MTKPPRYSLSALGARVKTFLAATAALAALTPSAQAADDGVFAGDSCLMFSDSWVPVPEYLALFDTVAQALELRVVLGVLDRGNTGCSTFVAVALDMGNNLPAIGLNDVKYARAFPALTGRHRVTLWQTLGAAPRAMSGLVDYRGSTLTIYDDSGARNDAALAPFLRSADVTVVEDGQGTRLVRIVSFGGNDIAHVIAQLRRILSQP